MMGADAALGIDEIMRRPILIVEGLPDGEIGIQRHRIGDAQTFHRLLHIGGIFFEGEFGRMHAQDHQAVILVLFRPGANVRQGAQAVDAGIGPEIHQHHLAAQRRARQRRGIQPAGGAIAVPASGLRREACCPPPPRSSPLCSRMQHVDQALLEPRGVGQGQSRQETGVESKGDRSDARQHQQRPMRGAPIRRRPTTVSSPANMRPPTSSASASEVAAPSGIGEQQQSGLYAGAADRRACQHQTQDRPRARRP